MSDPVSNRPSAGEEAAAAARRADATRDKKTENMATQQGLHGKKVPGQEKNLKSSFDDMLSKLSESSTPSANQEAAKFDSKLQEIHREQDQSGSSDRDKDDDKKPKEKSDAGKKTKEGSEITKERVVGKHQSGQGQQDSGKGGGEEKGGQGGGRQSQNKAQSIAREQAQAEELRNMQAAPAPAPPAPLQALNQVVAPEAVTAPRELPKALLDQIISHVRIGRDKDMNKVMEIEFQDQYFNGLQLRVTSHGKEVSVEFIVPNRSVKETFLQERENLAMTLGEKGIDCRAITVTLK